MSTKAWYEEAFDVDYLTRYAHRDQSEAESIVTLFKDRSGLAEGSRVFDLCCGGGRHAAALRQVGFSVTGLDLSFDLLREAKRHFHSNEGCAGQDDSGDCPDLVRGDMRLHPFADNSFDAVTHFFTAFGYFEEDEENFRVFNEVARVLKPGGFYLFDFLSAPFVRRALDDNFGVEKGVTNHDGWDQEYTKRYSDDSSRVEKTMQIFSNGEMEREIQESVRLFDPEELRAAMNRVGLAPIEEWGDYSGQSYNESESTRWIALAAFQS